VEFLRREGFGSRVSVCSVCSLLVRGILVGMKDFFVVDAAKFENATVTTYFVLSSFQVRDKKQGGQYIALTLSDKTGSLEGRMWDDIEEALASCSEGCYVKVQGDVSKYQGKFQITLKKMRLAAESEIDAADYQASTKFDVEEMWAELRGYVAAFRNEDLKRLVFSFLDDEKIGPAFKAAPAAKRLHHAWLGGLLEHVLTLVRVCVATVPFYPEVDPDLLVTGAILHDVGKVRELAWKSSFSYTLEGQMIGHISIAQGMLREKVQALAPFPEKLRVLVEHMILSHHGKYEFGSPKLPMTPEAILLSALDDLEAKMQAVRNEFAAAEALGKGSDEVTEWVRSMERPLFDSKKYLKGE
jgi:3'-5' exoribonuclease